MKKSFLLLAASAILTCQTSFAKIAVVDMDEVIQKSQGFTTATKQLEQKYAKDNQTLEKSLADMKVMQEKIKSSEKVVNADQLQKQKDALELKQKEFMTAQAEVTTKINQAYEKAMTEVISSIKEKIKQYAEQNSFEMVVFKQAVPYYSPSDDITTQVIANLNK